MNVEALALVVESITGADPLGSTRARPVVEARTLLACALLAQGHSETETGTLLGFNHATIHHYKGLLRDAKLYNNNPRLLAAWKELQRIYDL